MRSPVEDLHAQRERIKLGELIAKARQMTEHSGRRGATVEEARELLGLPAAAQP